ncbi:hypothetical protein AA310_12175 [Arthrobacter sp. YC-RL1]|uniref:DUF7620 family protein n=1 Tax=Arthrobacter sp. YC-RL1 TaxID=1652545 RepID=UPI00063DD938|nr:hypothetical protein [Arthrobacter sp. YC-RL1]ALQ30128.1 hypothetical protein ATC04_05845 [Arthrobacter sp. YC-RL1]KLI88547.1 hypothetical protein AA310_12175 [Arthrobacter sp. YC-RL1]
MSFWKRHKQAGQDADEALAAKIEADIELAAVRAQQREVAKQSEQLRQINKQNHFSEGLQRSFRGRPA